MTKRAIALAFLLVACADPDQLEAEKRAREWAASLNIKVDGLSCGYCTFPACFCGVAVGNRVIALECTEERCTVRCGR